LIYSQIACSDERQVLDQQAAIGHEYIIGPLSAQSVSSGNRKAAAQIRQARIFPPGVLHRRQTNAEPSLNRLASNDR
jgi:hypothetical protein